MSSSLLDRLFGGGNGTIYECRHCGTNLDDSSEPCPECGADEIAEFDL